MNDKLWQRQSWLWFCSLGPSSRIDHSRTPENSIIFSYNSVYFQSIFGLDKIFSITFFLWVYKQMYYIYFQKEYNIIWVYTILQLIGSIDCIVNDWWKLQLFNLNYIYINWQCKWWVVFFLILFWLNYIFNLLCINMHDCAILINSTIFL